MLTLSSHMDVTCNSCSTEYEFEEALVSPRGTTVKCTHCGHLFKVQRASSCAQLAAAQLTATTCWTIRQADGTTQALASLSELPRRIREGSFGRDDELSRTGQLWRRLGDIDELDEDFVAADRRGPSRAQRSVHPDAASQRVNQDKLEKVPERQAARPKPDAIALASEPAAQAAAGHQPTQRDSVSAVEAYRRAGVRHESHSHAWARLLTSAAIALAIAIWFFSLPPSGEQWSRAQATARPESAAISDPSQRFLAAADDALATHRTDHFDAALVEYIKALAYHEHDAHLLSAVSRVHALWAQELVVQRESASDAMARDALLQQTQAHAEQALHYADLALQSDSGAAEAELARADALRVVGDVAAARGMLDRALAHMPVTAESLRVAALQRLAEGKHSDAQTAVELATQAVAIDPSLLRVRLLFARLLLAQGDFDGARAQLDAVKARDPQHPAALRLQALLEAQAAEAQAVAAAGAAGAAASTGSVSSTKPTGELASLVERGRSQLDLGQLTAARRSFEHALSLQPDSLPAHAGLGQVAIARGRHVQAIDHLVAAALAGDADSLIALAETYRRLGRQHEALTAYQSYLQQNPHGPQLDLAKLQIERLTERLSDQLASARKP